MILIVEDSPDNRKLFRTLLTLKGHEIVGLMGGEEPHLPLSDETLVGLLHAQGVDIARRTVTKYRQGLRIRSSSARRRLAASRRRG